MIHSYCLDYQEIEEREKVVKHMWDAYTHTSSRIVLPKFWRRAFEAGYQDLINDDLGVRNAAISEIAKMSIRSFINLENPPDPIPPKVCNLLPFFTLDLILIVVGLFKLSLVHDV